MKTNINAIIALSATLALTACADEDALPDVSPAYCAQAIEMTIPADLEQYVYTDNTGAQVLPLVKGQTAQLGYILSPDTITFSDVIWQSSESSVATVADGLVEAVSGSGLGYSVISVSPVGMYSGSGVSGTLKVRVDDRLIQASELTLTASADEVYEGETVQLSADITPENSTYRTVKWTSSNDAIATVSATGLVTGVKVSSGTETSVTITASALDGSGTTATYDLIVKRIVQPESVAIDQTYSADGGYYCALNEQGLTLSFSTVPVDCTSSLIEWTSSDNSVATVEAGVVTFKGFGEATISAICPETGNTATIKLSIPAGLLRETFHNANHYSVYNSSQSGNGTSSSHEWHDGYLTITTYSQNATAQRADIKWWDTPVTLHAGNYPIIAIKVDDVKDLGYGISSRNLNFDVVGTSESGTQFKALGGGNNKYSTDIKCSDGSHVFVYDLSSVSFGTGGLAPTNESISFTTFQLKYADMKTVDHQVTYNLYWFQTFKTLADVQDYITNVDGLTIE